MVSLIQDLLFTFRHLRKHPAFALTAIISLALGIGATTAVFSVVYAILVNPYPYRSPDQLVYLVMKDKAGNNHGAGYSIDQIQRLRQVDAIQSVLAMDGWNLTTTDSDLPDDVAAAYLSPNTMTDLGVPALFGRTLIPSDVPEGQPAEPVVVLGYKFWQKHYGGRAHLPGTILQLSHKPYTIVGIMPPRFTWQGGDVYLPLNTVESPGQTYGICLRLKPDVSRPRADAELQPLIEAFAKQFPRRFPPEFRVRVQGLNVWVERNLGGTLRLLLAAVGLMLLIGCANVSILLLARGTARQSEFALRAAIGAQRRRIARQLLTESLVLSLSGAVAGVGMAALLIRLILRWMPDNLFPSEASVRINLPVLLFTIAVAILTGVIFGLWPALQLSRPDLAQVMQSGSRRTTGGPRGKRMHGMLVGGQVALTLVLLTGAGQALAAFSRLMHTDLGYDPHHIMSVFIPVHQNTHMQWEDRAEYFERIRRQIADVPGVVDAGISTNGTPPSNGWVLPFEIFAQSKPQALQAHTSFVGPEYFTVLHIGLAAGRLWTPAEVQRGAHLALVNQTLARQYWPGGDALGQQIRVPLLKAEPLESVTAPGSDGWLQIIGVVKDARDDGLDKPVKPAIYVPYTLNLRLWTQILVRARGAPLALLQAVRRQVYSVDADEQVMGNTQDLDQWIAQRPEWAGARLISILLTGFSILALALAVFGLYSVVSHAVMRRTNEFGIRMALGAQGGAVRRLVFASTAISVGAGLGAGLILSVVLNRVLAAWIQESSRDPVILTAVVLLLAGAAAAACWIPARRASLIDPMAALRCE
jgi:putative ABC transport system permease protein